MLEYRQEGRVNELQVAMFRHQCLYHRYWHEVKGWKRHYSLHFVIYGALIVVAVTFICACHLENVLPALDLILQRLDVFTNYLLLLSLLFTLQHACELSIQGPTLFNCHACYKRCLGFYLQVRADLGRYVD